MDASIILTASFNWLPSCNSFMFYLDGFTANPAHPVIEPWFIATSPTAPFIIGWFNELNRVFSNFNADTHAYHDYLKHAYGDDMYSAILQRIGLPYYLTVTVAAMKTIVADKVEQPCTIPAESEPLKALLAEDWRDGGVAVGIADYVAGVNGLLN
ncbi:hypothetical protein BC829DRAFT_64345 [Chytridium lagenaria]|nr:hypothetical protein BC829DRAFT_64345 [Chytridium lagenaria]